MKQTQTPRILLPLWKSKIFSNLPPMTPLKLALQIYLTSSSLVSATGAGSPSLTSTTFEGINSSNTPFVPPDVSLAVGVRRVIQMVNGLFSSL